MEVARHLRHVGLPQRVEAIQKGIALSVMFIKRPSRHTNAVTKRTLDLGQGHLRLGTMRDVFGNAGSLPTRPVIRPTLGKKQIAVEQ